MPLGHIALFYLGTYPVTVDCGGNVPIALSTTLGQECLLYHTGVLLSLCTTSGEHYVGSNIRGAEASSPVVPMFPLRVSFRSAR